MKLKDRITEAVAAAFSAIWVQSYEHENAIQEIAAACEAQNWDFMTWDAEQGVIFPKGASALGNDPSIVSALQTLRNVKVRDKSRAVMVLRNMHTMVAGQERRVGNALTLQTLQTTIEIGAEKGLHVIALSYPGIPLPVELEKAFLVIDHDLPNGDEIWDILTQVEDIENLPKHNSREAQLLKDAAAGLTRLEAISAFSLSLARHAKIQPDTLWELKEGMLKKSGLLTMRKPKSGFDMIGGLNHIKDFCLRAIESPNKSKTVRARGVIIVGPPGCCKTAFADSLGFEVGLPTIELNVGMLMGGVVGQTEAQTERAFSMIDAMAPCVLFADELEKMLAGVGGGARDSGVNDRLFGRFLTWLNDHESDVFVVGTCNDISQLSAASKGAFSRAERFDGLFFVDLPGREQKDMIWKIWLNYFNLDASQTRPKDDVWTGAEIRSACRLAALFNTSLMEVSQQIVPVAVSSGDQITALKEFAHQRYLSADYKGVYNKDGYQSQQKMMTASEITRPRRRITRAATATVKAG